MNPLKTPQNSNLPTVSQTGSLDKPAGGTPRVLIVAGSDPVAGAGMQADLKVATAFGVYAMTAVTAITVQDTRRVHRVVPLAPELVAGQMRVCLEEIGADCIKLGMLGNRAITRAVAQVLREHPRVPVVADPVLAGTQGGILLEPGGLEAYREELLPRVTLLTPNLPEAAALTGLTVTALEQMRTSARELRRAGAGAVLVKGGHLEGEVLHDWLDAGEQTRLFTDRRLSGPGFHGTGCVLASAIAAGLARGVPLDQAVADGRVWLRGAMEQSLALGTGQRLLWRQ
ncbi:MAG: bifunctional hydroxymethylpyrimidine kinase/phosphomethylpyrimidine kinase [Magnetococcales bacterium]|nr:bifunctional hydroxymethylpyrimidine kinase/phosphomethylpyrimidine kinase [Magnetococcales bacterium]